MSADFSRYRSARRKRHLHKRAALESVWKLLSRLHPGILTILVALILSAFIIHTLESRLRPVLETAARLQIKNAVTIIMEDAICSELDSRKIVYSNFVSVERAENGMITAITTNAAEMNRLRSALVDAILEYTAEIDEEAIEIPVGSLIDSELIWGRGPSIKVRTFTTGTVSAEFQSEFISAGINQTLHKIWIELSVPTVILLPGAQLDVLVETRMCVAETVIVGSVPNYMQKTLE